MSASLRTPRRRFSPRAKRRYYHIKNFLKKTLGNSSQEDSSRDKQSLYLDDKQCQDLPCLRDKSSEEVIYEGSRESKKRNPKSEYEREHESGGSARYHSECYEGDATRYLHKNTKFKSESYSIPYKEKKKRRSKHTTRYDPYDDEHPLYPAEASPHLSSSHHAATHRKTHLHVTTSGYSDLRYEKEYKRHRDLDERQSKDKKSKKKHDKHKIEYERYEEEPRRHRKGSSILDHDFIDDIIKRQYQHVTMFNSQGTVMSQISAPVCRDRDLALQESILEAHDLCSCMFDRESPRGDRRSICDTRLYSTHKKKHRSKHCRKDKKHEDKYNDMSLDLVPVKEKSSPKPRRKIDMDSTVEVPPSPRTNRPRLNLQAHYRDDDDNDVTPSDSPRTEQCRRDQFLADQYEHNLREMELRKSYKSPERYQNEYLPTHDLHSFVDQSQNVQIEQMDTQANFVTPRDPNDHTGEALTEIKDILQTFLNEIKKDAQAYLAEAQSPEVARKDHILEDKTEPPKVIETVPVQVPSPPITAAPAPFTAVSSQGPSTSFQQFGFGKNSPYQMAPPFSPACFPMMCPPAPYLMPGSGYTFPCVTSLHRTQSRQDNKTERTSESSKEKIETTNTDELLKQIYKIVAQNPKGTEAQKESRVVEEQKESTSDSESNGNAVSVNGAKEDKKSLQEIFNHGPDGSFESHQERFSAAATRTDSNLFDDSYKMKKRKSGIFGKIIQSIGVFGLGLFKSRSNIEERSDHGRHQQRHHKERSRSPWAARRDAIKREFEELRRQKGSRSPSPRHPPPRTPWDYNTHPAPPPLHPPPHPQPHPQHTGYEYPPPVHYPVPSPDQPPPSMYPPSPPMMYEQPQSPTAPPYFNMQQQYHMQQQQMPFCLKEVEVKSIGTQSQVKLNIFKKFKNKKAKSPRPKWMPDHDAEPPQYNKQFMKMQQAMQMQKKQMQMQKQMQMHQKMQMRSEESTPREKSKKPFNFLENEFLKTREKVARDSEIQGDFVKTLFGKPLARGANKGPSWLKSIFEKPNFDCTKPGIKF